MQISWFDSSTISYTIHHITCTQHTKLQGLDTGERYLHVVHRPKHSLYNLHVKIHILFCSMTLIEISWDSEKFPLKLSRVGWSSCIHNRILFCWQVYRCKTTACSKQLNTREYLTREQNNWSRNCVGAIREKSELTDYKQRVMAALRPTPSRIF